MLTQISPSVAIFLLFLVLPCLLIQIWLCLEEKKYQNQIKENIKLRNQHFKEFEMSKFGQHAMNVIDINCTMEDE